MHNQHTNAAGRPQRTMQTVLCKQPPKGYNYYALGTRLHLPRRAALERELIDILSYLFAASVCCHRGPNGCNAVIHVCLQPTRGLFVLEGRFELLRPSVLGAPSCRYKLFFCHFFAKAILYGKQKRLQNKKTKNPWRFFVNAALWAPKHGNSALQSLRFFVGGCFPLPTWNSANFCRWLDKLSSAQKWITPSQPRSGRRDCSVQGAECSIISNTIKDWWRRARECESRWRSGSCAMGAGAAVVVRRPPEQHICREFVEAVEEVMGPDKLSAGVAGAVGWVTPRNYRRSRREGCVRASELNLRRFSENRTSRQTCCNSGEPDRRVLKLHTSAKFTSTFDLIRPRSRLLCTVTNDFDLIVLHSLDIFIFIFYGAKGTTIIVDNFDIIQQVRNTGIHLKVLILILVLNRPRTEEQ